MSKPKTKRRARIAVPSRAQGQLRRHAVKRPLVLAFVGLAGVGLLLGASWGRLHSAEPANPSGRSLLPSDKTPQTLNALLALPGSELEHIDIALMNLLCAQGLPGAEGAGISQCLRTLDEWAAHVQTETERHQYRFAANPKKFYSSEGFFRMLMMAVVMYEDFSVRYDPERMSAPESADPNDAFFADSRDVFVHGLLSSRRLGTCSSMPVLYAAVGRRLGYPLKLVTTRGHLFLRWEDRQERFDLEATGKGMNRYDDEHFKNWPFAVSEEEIRAEGYMKSLSGEEELALFLALRGSCLKDNGRLEESAGCYAQAARLAPSSRSYALLAGTTVTHGFPTPPPASPMPMQAGAMSSQLRDTPRLGQANFGQADPNPLLKLRNQ